MTRLTCMLALLLVAPIVAQSPPPAVTFEVADVRPAAPNPSPNNTHGGVLRGNRYEIRNVPMIGLISAAYGVDGETLRGGPPWLEINRYDIVALAPPNTTPATIRTMLKQLLADRFKLAVREDKQQIVTFILRAGASTRLRRAAGGPVTCQVTPRALANGAVMRHMACTNTSMAALAARLPLPGMAADYIPENLQDLVDDQTGLTGAWDFELDWTPRDQLLQAGAEAVTLQQALQNIGLRLEEGKIAAPVLVIDGVNAMPTPNAADVAAKLPPRPPPVFEVASVKPSSPEATTPRARLLPTGQVEFSATPLRQMLNFAWQVRNNEYLIAPDWVESKRYDVIARAWATPVTDAQREGDQLLLMLRQLILDRFKMKFHIENRPVGAFVLTADTPKMTKSDPSARTRCNSVAATGRNPALTRHLTCQNVTMAQFADLLPNIVNDYLRAPVADMTGLEGAWNFTVNYSPQSVFNPTPGTGDAGAASTPTGALSIFEAIDRQLGLKLRPERRSLPVMVIDSISQDVDGN